MNDPLLALVQQAFGEEGRRPAAIEAVLREGKVDCKRLLEATLLLHAELVADSRRQAEESARAETQTENLLELLGTILESSDAGILALGPDDRIARFNEQFAQLFRIPDDILAFWAHDEVLAALLSRLRDPQSFRDRLAWLCATPQAALRETLELNDGRIVEWRAKPQPSAWGGVKRVIGFLDVTERFRSEAERQLLARRLDDTQRRLSDAERMAAVGQLAAGVAHEINNPIGFVSGNINTLGRYADTLLSLLTAYEKLDSAGGDRLDSARNALLEARSAADLDFLREDLPTLVGETQTGLLRVQGIVQGLRDFARDSGASWKVVDVTMVLEEAVRQAQARCGFAVQVQRDWGELPPMECLVPDIGQAFANLLTNACQAVRENGRIHLRARRDDQGICVEIADEGVGIPPDILPRIFEPFFTTRPVGQGTGLGLAVAYGIVRRHGGDIQAESRPGQGSVFRVRLPLVEGEAGQNRKQQSADG